MTHTDGSGVPLKINGLPSQSPLANNALYSSEHSKGRILNLYEIMLPDIPGKHGEPSTNEIYVKLLVKYGLDVAGSYVFTRKDGKRIDRGVTAIYHQSSCLDPFEFNRRTIKAIQKRLGECKDAHYVKDHHPQKKSHYAKKDKKQQWDN